MASTKAFNRSWCRCSAGVAMRIEARLTPDAEAAPSASWFVPAAIQMRSTRTADPRLGESFAAARARPVPGRGSLSWRRGGAEAKEISYIHGELPAGALKKGTSGWWTPQCRCRPSRPTTPAGESEANMQECERAWRALRSRRPRHHVKESDGARIRTPRTPHVVPVVHAIPCSCSRPYGTQARADVDSRATSRRTSRRVRLPKSVGRTIRAGVLRRNPLAPADLGSQARK